MTEFLSGCTGPAAQACGLLEWIVARIHRILQNEAALRDVAKVLAILVITLGLEIAGRKNWRARYGSYHFTVDTVYYIFYYSGLYHFLVFAWIYSALAQAVGEHAPWMQTHFLAGLPPAVQMVVIVVASDFLFYWYHRLMHSNRYLWAFHSIHHSQTKLTVMTTYRYHIVDETLHRLWVFIPFQVLGYGVDVALWLWFDFLIIWVGLVQHSEWNWSYGPAGRVFVSPRFHRMHHSTDQRVANRNFSAIFSFWDDLFGTAERKAEPPTVYGIAGNPIRETLLAQFVYPFVKIAHDLRRPAQEAAPASGNVIK